MQELITKTLKELGPLTGAELRETLKAEGFPLWSCCMLSDQISVERVGRRYLRLDQKVEGYARLSPSILREFLTYCAVGLTADAEALAAKKAELSAHIAAVSAAKLKLGRRIVAEVGARLSRTQPDAEQHYCIMLAGDIVYGMGHDAPRSERSTGQMVRGSDVDLVVITEDDAPAGLGKLLDASIYQEKYRHLNNPAFREEIDYVVKPLERMKEQVAFDTFKHMVSCKILDEAVLLYGSEKLYQTAKNLLVERDISSKLAVLENTAIEARAKAERQLLERDGADLAGEDLYLFHTSEETEEFE